MNRAASLVAFCGVALAAGVARAQIPAVITPLPAASPSVVQYHGASIAVIGDINGDGVPDIAIGSLYASNNIGRVYIYSGANNQLIRTLVSPVAEVDNFYGASLSGVPDIDGDGVPDIAVGAPNDSPGASAPQCGRVYLYSGATGRFINRLIPPNPQFSGHFGESVAGIADVNGDGRGDIVVGAPDEVASGLAHAGRVYVFSGATGSLIRTLSSLGPTDSGQFGYSVARIADVNGDGKDDIIVGAPKERPDNAGRVYIYSGATGAFLKKMLSPSPQLDGRFGYAVAAVPDANGDGVADVIVGAPREFNHQGRAYLFSGATGVQMRVVQSPGIQDEGRFGEAVAGVPDINGDGRGDFVIGAPHENPGTSPEDCGRAYVYSGATGGFLTKLLPPSPQLSGYFGYAVAGVPDNNGNGRGEVVVGSPGEDSVSTTTQGIAYIYRY